MDSSANMMLEVLTVEDSLLPFSMTTAGTTKRLGSEETVARVDTT